jgi:hypothetical protein
VSRRTSPADRMHGRRVPLTPGATLRFGSLGFVYTGPAESVTGRTFVRPFRPNVLTGAAGREAFIRGFSNETIIGMLGPNPTKECFRLATYYLTDLASRKAEPSRLLGGVHGAVHREVPPWEWTQRPVIDNLHRTSRCRSSPVRGTASGGSAAQQPNNHGPAHRHRRPGGEHATATDAPMRALTSTLMSTLTLRHSSGGCRRTSPQQPCCCTAVQRLRPLRRDGCASS